MSETDDSIDRDPDPVDAMRRLIQSEQADRHTCLPGKIEAFDPATGKADASPTLQRTYTLDDGTEETHDLPVITNAPVAFPQGGGFFIGFPLTKDDPVVLLFAERSMDGYLDSDGVAPVEVEDARQQHLSDAIVLPGLQTFKTPNAHISATDMVIGRKDGKILVKLKPSGSGAVVMAGGQVLMVGSDTASRAVALAAETVARLSAIESALGALIAVLIPAAGGVVPPVGGPFIPSTADPTSARLKTDG